MTWLTATVGDACLPTTQVDPMRLGRTTFRYVDIASIDRDAKTITKADALSADDAPSRARRLIEASDILVSTVRPNLNAIAVVPNELDGEIASTGFCVLRANRKIATARFLYYWAQHANFVDFLVANATGASYPAVSDSIIKRAPLPLPPLGEQRRIVELLDQADALRRLRREADAKAAGILTALFLKMFGDPATNPMGWPVKKLGDCADTSSGGTPDTKAEKFYDGEIPWVKSGELSSRVINKAEETISIDGLKNSSAKWVEPGAVLVAMYGATVGQVALLNIRATTNQAICAIRPRDGVLVGYLIELLRLSKSVLLSKRVGGAQPNISQQIVRNLEVMIPPEALQKQFAAQASDIESIVLLASAAGEQIDSIFSSVLQDAFSGRLTAKWRQAHMHELLAEMQQQVKALKLPLPKEIAE